MVAEAIRQTLLDLVDALASLESRYALMGGIAVAAWEHLRVTHDVDVLVAIPEEQIESVVEHFRARGFRPKGQPPVIEVGTHKFIQLLYEAPDSFLEIRVDLLLATSEFQRSALERGVMTELSGMDRQVAVVSCEDLIILKLLAGRIIDRADVMALLRANRDHLDLDQLVGWATRLGLTQELAGTWDEAFPGEALPARQS